MRAIPLFLLSMACVIPCAAQAKPLITNSEQTLVSVCTSHDDTNERLLQICAAALNEPGLTARKRAEILTAHGDALSWLDRDKEARAKYEEALKDDPFYADAHEGLGWVHWVDGAYTEAAQSFKTALDLSPSSDALGGLASSQVKTGAIAVDEAETLFDAALAMEPANRWVMRQKGWMLLGAERYGAAAGAFQSAVDVDDQDANALEGLSLAHYHLDEDETALRYINAAITAAPQTHGYLQRRSMILLALDRPAAALRDAEAYLQDRPERAIGYVRKGRALSALGRTQEALSVMSEARDRLPSNGTLDYWYAMSLSDDGQHARAWPVLSHLLEGQEGDFWDYVLLAFLSVKTDRLDAASKAVDYLKQLRPRDYYTHYWDAVTRVYVADIDGAEEVIRKAIAQGLGDGLLSDFIEHMVGQGYHVRAAALRLKLNQERVAQGSVLDAAQ